MCAVCCRRRVSGSSIKESNQNFNSFSPQQQWHNEGRQWVVCWRRGVHDDTSQPPTKSICNNNGLYFKNRKEQYRRRVSCPIFFSCTFFFFFFCFLFWFLSSARSTDHVLRHNVNFYDPWSIHITDTHIHTPQLHTPPEFHFMAAIFISISRSSSF